MDFQRRVEEEGVKMTLWALDLLVACAECHPKLTWTHPFTIPSEGISQMSLSPVTTQLSREDHPSKTLVRSTCTPLTLGWYLRLYWP